MSTETNFQLPGGQGTDTSIVEDRWKPASSVVQVRILPPGESPVSNARLRSSPAAIYFCFARKEAQDAFESCKVLQESARASAHA